MKERLVALAGAGILTAGCSNVEGGVPSPEDFSGELLIENNVNLYQGPSLQEHDRILRLKIGDRVVGICLHSTSAESATTQTGWMEVAVGSSAIVGYVQTIASLDSAAHPANTFQVSEDALSKSYPRCNDARRA